jgi:hypothetical protein
VLKKPFASCLFGVLLGGALSLAHARGRQPDEGADGFPDYNRLEMHPKPKDAQTAPPAVSDKPAAPSVPTTPPALNTPTNPSSDEDTPQPPPKAVPVPDSAGEPPMPEDIKDTLIQTTTDQK